MGDFRTLDVWRSGRELRVKIGEIVKEFPKEEKYRLTDQIIRSCRSVPDNIAEGYGRYYYKEQIRFNWMARGSLMETLNHLETAKDEGYIDLSLFDKLDKEINLLYRRLSAYINYLSSQAENAKQKHK